MFHTDPFEPMVQQLTRTPSFVPATDVTVSDGDLVLAMDVPGLSTEDLSIELVDNYLIVRGQRRAPAVTEGVSFAHRERAFGRFERYVKVPDGVDPDAITASVDDGVLSLIVPKPERLKPRTISIGAGSSRREIEPVA
jgi:HSP20 family protein